MYHSIGDLSLNDKKDLFSRSWDDFKIDCEIISKFIHKNNKNVILTFDDGYKSSLEAAEYAYINHKIKSLIFLITDQINSNNFISEEMISKFNNQGNITFGFHGKTHTPFTNLKKKQIIEEIKIGKSKLENICKKKIEHFSYPHGLRSLVTDSLLVQNGFKFIFTSEYGVLNKNLYSNINKEMDYKLISRNCILKKSTSYELYLILRSPSFNMMIIKQKIKRYLIKFIRNLKRT